MDNDDFRPLMMTSHVFQRAVSFLHTAPPPEFRGSHSRRFDNPHDCTLYRPFVVCTQRFFSAIPPLLACTPGFFVRASDMPVFSKSPAFVFVFRINVEGNATEMRPVIARLISAETLPFLEHLTLRCWGVLKPADELTREDFSAFISNLPEKRIRTLSITGSTFSPYFDDEWFCENLSFLLRTKQPFLESLHLQRLVSPFFDSKVAPALSLPVPFFPNLKRLKLDNELYDDESPILHPLLTYVKPLMFQLRELSLPVCGEIAETLTGAFVVPEAPLLVKVSNFLFEHDNLTSVDFAGVPNIVDLGDDFLAGCSNLEGTVDLSGLTEAQIVGESFMNDCGSVTRLILPPSLRRIGLSFCFGMRTLVDVNFAELKRLEQVSASFFFESCRKLAAPLDTTPLLGTLGTGCGDPVGEMLAHCSALQVVDLAGLEGVVELGGHFLYQLQNLREVKNVARGLGRVRKFGQCGFQGCSRLAEFPFHDLAALEEVKEWFFDDCETLSGSHKLDLSQNHALRAAPPRASIQNKIRWILPAHLVAAGEVDGDGGQDEEDRGGDDE